MVRVGQDAYVISGCPREHCVAGLLFDNGVGLAHILLCAMFMAFIVSGNILETLGEQPKGDGEAANSAASQKPITSTEAERFAPLHRAFYLAALRGADWLARQQRPDGSFPAGFIPCLNMALDGDHYVRQAQATLALAQAARLSGQEKWSAQAKQSVLWLLAGTVTDTQQPPGRSPRPPLVLMSRLSATGLLLAAIHELPQPANDLLDAAEELAYWVQRQQQADGTLRLGEPGLVGTLPSDINEETDPQTYGPGQALWGLAKSQTGRPQVWKLDLLRRARQPYYRIVREPSHASSNSLADGKPMAAANGISHPVMAIWHLAAWAEAYRHTRERPFAEYVFEVADGLLALQYTDASKPLYMGGFVLSLADKAKSQPPDWRTAYFAWALTLAARTARLAGDQNRYTRYVLAAEGALQFLTTLQYTALNTAHFADHYQPKILGGFRTGLREGLIRAEAQQAITTALWTYLEVIVCAR